MSLDSISAALDLGNTLGGGTNTIAVTV